MQVEVRAASQNDIHLRAPLAPNINHRGSAFGGSIATLATLACWSLLRVRLDQLSPLPHLVVRRSNIEYTASILGEFDAVAHCDDGEDWNNFLRQYEAKGRARIRLNALITTANGVAATFWGDFVALG
jgi:thioesterase domain-containing protein